LTVSNGKKIWTYDERANVVHVENATGKALDFIEALKLYDVKHQLGSEEIAGRDCYVIELKSKSGLGTGKRWIDKQ